uniref:Uncharacterized protein n=1 Tax=Pseudomonas phage Ulitu01 TaxID=3138550 RepID=A0AAU6W015_9CAUD
MQLISSLCLPNEAGGMQGILSLKGKDLIYGKRTNRYGWIGVAHKLTENGALVVFRNGVEQAYSIDTFVQTFCPAHWSKNQGFRTESLALAVNRVSMNPQSNLQLQAGTPADIRAAAHRVISVEADDPNEVHADHYVWRIGGPAPTVAHPKRSIACAEAARLAAAHPGKEFVVLHKLVTYVAQQVTTIKSY